MTAFTSPLAEEIGPDLLQRFLSYVQVHTRSDPHSPTCPSTECQWDLARQLVEELKEIGLEDVDLDDNGYVMATLPGNANPDRPVIGLLAHIDTEPGTRGDGVKPIVHRNYDGSTIQLPHGGTQLDPEAMPLLKEKVGHDLITTSGDTLLGADDKAGMAAVMAAVNYLHSHPDLPRPTIRVAFNPDEEIGRGPHRFDVEKFGARCAYTLDGSEVGELSDESFSAIGVVITIAGTDIHPGSATGIMVNSLSAAARIVSALPIDRLTPATTRDREGFIHVVGIEGGVSKTVVELIVRDFDEEKLASHLEFLRSTAEEVMTSFPKAKMEFEANAQYPNMRKFIDKFPAVTEAARRAIEAEGLEVKSLPIRGGTDGSQLSAMGLPTPNLFDGSYEMHSVREWTTLQDMSAAAATVVHLARIWATDDDLA